MADTPNQRRGPAPRDLNDGQQGGQNVAPPWDYERHLQTQHNLLVEAEKGWPTAVKRYRLYRPMEKNRREQTLLAFTGTGPEAMAHFFRYTHPPVPTQARPHAPAGRPA